MTSVCWCAGDAAAVLTISTAYIATNIRAAFQIRPWHMFNMIAASRRRLLRRQPLRWLRLFLGLIVGQGVRSDCVELDFRALDPTGTKPHDLDEIFFRRQMNPTAEMPMDETTVEVVNEEHFARKIPA